jgi:1,6-anhydro-N-acetylmuramate kinase
MTGTSMDALDAVLLTVEGNGLELRAALRRCLTHPLDSLAEPLRRLALSEPMPAGQTAELARDLALRHIALIRELARGEPLDLVAVHGQTIFHAPPLSWQLLAPAPIVAALQVPTVFDLRAADLAAGGEGAPITPIADYVLFRHDRQTRAIINLGGFANYTLLPARSALSADAQRHPLCAVRGGDICACNQLLDALARQLFGKPFDEDGRRAAAGRVRADVRDSLVALLRQQARAGRSLGTGDELGGWVAGRRAHHSGADLARSACEALAVVIGETIAQVADEHEVGPLHRVLLAGGGVNNPVLCAALARQARAETGPTDDCGVPAGYREAVAMAILGALSQDGVPITLPQITGVREPAPLAGAWIYPVCGPALPRP